MQRHRKNRTENKERRQAIQRNTTQKTKKDEGHGRTKKKIKKKIKIKKTPGKRKRFCRIFEMKC